MHAPLQSTGKIPAPRPFSAPSKKRTPVQERPVGRPMSAARTTAADGRTPGSPGSPLFPKAKLPPAASLAGHGGFQASAQQMQMQPQGVSLPAATASTAALGRVRQELLGATASPTALAAMLKSDILAAQRKIDQMRGVSNGQELQALERHLMSVEVAAPEAPHTTEALNTLYDALLSRMSRAAQVALSRVNAGGTSGGSGAGTNAVTATPQPQHRNDMTSPSRASSPGGLPPRASSADSRQGRTSFVAFEDGTPRGSQASQPKAQAQAQEAVVPGRVNPLFQLIDAAEQVAFMQAQLEQQLGPANAARTPSSRRVSIAAHRLSLVTSDVDAEEAEIRRQAASAQGEVKALQGQVQTQSQQLKSLAAQRDSLHHRLSVTEGQLAAQETPALKGSAAILAAREEKQQLRQQIQHSAALEKELKEAKRRIAEFEADVKRRKEGRDDDGDTIEARALRLAFYPVDQEVLDDAKVDPARFAVPPVTDAEALTARLRDTIAEHIQALPQTRVSPSGNAELGMRARSTTIAGPVPSVRGRAEKAPAIAPDTAASNEGALWAVLAQQHDTLRAVSALATDRKAALKAVKESAAAEEARLRRVIAAYMERIDGVKATAVRGAAEVTAGIAMAPGKPRRVVPAELLTKDKPAALPGAVAGANLEETALQLASKERPSEPAPEADSRPSSATRPSTAEVAQDVKATGAAKGRVAVKGQPPTMAERQRLLQQEVAVRDAALQDVQARLDSVTATAEAEEKLKDAALAELRRLRAEYRSDMDRAGEQRRLNARLEEELRHERVTNVQLKSDVRDRVRAEGELQQRLWKQNVELHVSQNVIAELRKSEDDLTAAQRDAGQVNARVTQTLAGERRERAVESTRLREQARTAQAEEDVAKRLLQHERTKMLRQETEIDRLKQVDAQMATLEQNFANYAACKIAQREADEEEEHILQECVELIGVDVFALPLPGDCEEQIEIYLEQLRVKKDALDAEERARQRSKQADMTWSEERSARKQLAFVMQQRYTAVQIFAAEQRLRQMSLEQKHSTVVVELEEITAECDELRTELSHTKQHGDLLVQRASDLEKQRREAVEVRTLAEREAKALRNQVHKMRVTGEEQEKALIDVGTRLQMAVHGQNKEQNVSLARDGSSVALEPSGQRSRATSAASSHGDFLTVE